MKNTESLYSQLFEELQTYAEEDLYEEEALSDILSLLEDEILKSELVCTLENGEYKVTKLAVINTVINALLPGYRLYADVDEKQEIVHHVYLGEILEK